MNSSSVRCVVMCTVLGLAVAARAEAQTCLGAESMDRDHPTEVGGLFEFGEGSSSLGGAATFGDKHAFVGGAVERVSSGNGLFGSSSNASLGLRADAGAPFTARKGALAICPLAEVGHVGSSDPLDPQATGGTLSIEGGVSVGFVGAHSDDFRIVPLVGGGVVRTRESEAAPHGTTTTVWTTGGVVRVGLGLVRQDSASFVVSYTVAFNSARAASTLGIALNFAVGHK